MQQNKSPQNFDFVEDISNEIDLNHSKIIFMTTAFIEAFMQSIYVAY